MPYPQSHDSSHDGVSFGVTPSPSFPQVEEEILSFWERDDTFRASVAQREGAPEWVFYDGPPFANGLPHYGHLLTGYAKDLFPRFQTMRGKQVHRRFGWDTHGLPAELEAERQLGITDKSEIERMGIAAFNRAARESVLHYTDEWREYVTRQARWVDFENDYKTLDISYMESVLWAFKRLYDKGLAYEGHRVLPYCWRDETPLSNHELRMDDDVYKSRQDQTLTVTFPLTGKRAEALGVSGVKALAWTTTPWTLPTNLALAVGPQIDYVVVPAGPNGTHDAKVLQEAAGEDSSSTAAPGGEYLIARELLAGYAQDLGYEDAEHAYAAIRTSVVGEELQGTTYVPLFDYYTDAELWGTQEAWQVLADDYVSTTDGTGIVHQAPAYGEDDQRVCEAASIPVILSVDDGGRFVAAVSDVAGQLWSEANKPLARKLKQEGRVLRQSSYVHSYPHCWRCRNPLIYKAVSSWFVKVPEFRDRMVEVNQEINWVPENVKDGQFGKWLEGAREWSISRNRYWGSPIPVWKSDNPEYPRVDVYGSLDELEADFGVRPSDLHRPYIDELTRPNPDDPSGRSTMRRITDVFDVWFDSGSMPYAQVHYPFENSEWFESHNPADFIVEYIGQTRGWFYLLHVLSTAIFDRPAFKNVVSHGIVLGSDGQKMSKSLRNYPDVNEVFDRDGSDAMRWFLMSSSVLRGGNLVVTEEGIREGVRQLLLPLWNTWYFFALYANNARSGGYEARRSVASEDVLDRYILAKLRQLIADVTGDLEAFDSPVASAKLRDFADVLTNWYVRRSRDRFWRGVAEDGAGAEAFDTLYTVLETLCRISAPMIPLVSERVWKDLTGKRSVHLEDWPDPEEFPQDEALVSAMDRVREITSVVQALRKHAGLRVRLPLQSLTVVTPQADALRRFESILRDELNVKEVSLLSYDESSAERFGIHTRLSVNARAAGPRLGGRVQQVIRAAKAGEWTQDENGVVVDGIQLREGEYELALETDAADGTSTALLSGDGFVQLDTTTTPALEAEGLARDMVRAVQEARRAAHFDVSDRIQLALVFQNAEDAEDVKSAATVDIAAETLAREYTVDSSTELGGDGAALDELMKRHLPRTDGVELVSAGTYANRGSVVIGVMKKEGDH